jgi:hypothetical protein
MTDDLLDSVHPEVLMPLGGPVACYRDGRESQWSDEMVTALRARIFWNITVLGDPAWEVFDYETGNAGATTVAASVVKRFKAGLFSVVYVNESQHQDISQALAVVGIHWTDRRFYPEPGCYLWAAAPGTPPGTSPPWCPVPPVAVQDRWLVDHDASTLFVPTQIPPKPPTPKPTPTPAPVPVEVKVTVQLLQLQEGASGDAVRGLQILLNGRGGYALATDGVFGPKTQTAVREYQQAVHLGVDGVAGTHTLGHLLGVPQ